MTPAYKNPALNETYVVRYTMTTNGSEPAEPTLANSTLYSGPITCTVAGTRYKAKTFAVSCENQVSATSVSYTVEKIFAPNPVITFGDQMSITAAQGESTFDIVYTIDGSDPVVSPLHGTHSATTVSLTGLIDYGTTVKAIAYKATNAAGDPDPNYEVSAIVTKIYVPTDEDGNTVNGTYGTVVLLDDREPHTWNYYNDTDATHPHSLKPADVKITYAGNGTRNMTANTSYSPSTDLTNTAVYTENATNVHVNIDASENEFIYLKTLENDDPEGVGNTYTYQMIPNPFQVRPVHVGSKGGETTDTSLQGGLESGIENGIVKSLEGEKAQGKGGQVEQIHKRFPFEQNGRGSRDMTAVLPNTQALTTSFVNVGSDQNIQIKTSSANNYTNPLRFYANVTATIQANSGYKITSVTYEASSTGNYVTYAQNATVSPSVTPTVSGKNVTWDYSSSSSDVTVFTFKPASQTRCNSITITYISTITPSITASDVVLDYDANSGSILYSISNDPGGTLTATSSESWLTINNGEITSTEVPFICSANPNATLRTATVTLTYTYGTKATETKDITVTQMPNNGTACPSIQFSNLGYSNQQVISNATISTLINVEFNKGTGSTSPAYYTTGEAVCVYGGGYFTVSTTGSAPITSIDLTFGTGDGTNTITANTGTYSSSSGTWTGSASSVTFTVGGTTGHRRIAGIEVCSTPTIVVDPTVSIAASANSGTITYSVSGATGGSMTASSSESWLTIGTITSEAVSFTCYPNTGAERTATVTLTYTYGTKSTITADVLVTQGASCTITSFPWTETFNGLTEDYSIPDCWDNTDGTTTTDVFKWWYTTSTGGYGATNGTGHGGNGNCVSFNSYSNDYGNTNCLKTPVIDLSSVSEAYLSFWFKNPEGGDLSVYISTDGGTTYTTSLATGLTDQSDWTARSIDISSYAGQSNVVIVFIGTSNWGVGDAYLYLDDVAVTTSSAVTTFTLTYNANGGTGTMTDPSSPYTDGSTVTVMSNGFTAPSGKIFDGWNTAANGSGVSYAPGATFTIMDNTTLYAQWTNLTVCTPTWTSTSSSYYYITNFTATVDGESSAQINNTTTGTGRTTQDYYGTYSITAEAGSTIKYNTTPSYSSGTYRYGLWVDWNQDGTFDDSGDERIYNTSSYITIAEQSFTIPASTTPGDYRMRVMIDYYGSGNYLAPCGSNNNGEAEDYKLTVTAPTVHYTVAAVSDWGVNLAYVTSGSDSNYSLSVDEHSSVTFQAVVARNATFQGWYNGSTLVSSSNPYTVSDVTADLTLTAKAVFNNSSDFCEGFESYSSDANTSISTAGSLPTKWYWEYGGDYYNTNYAPHLYNGDFAKDGVGIVFTAGTASSYGTTYYLISDIALIEDATVRFNTWVESTSRGTMYYGYVLGDSYTSLGVATTASYSSATNTDGLTTFTVPSSAAGGILTFVWTYSSSYYSAVIDNVCVEYSEVPTAPVFSLASGDYMGAQTVSITCSTASATIYYTTDGTTPTASSSVYSGSLTLNSSTTLKAIAINSIGSSAVTTATYNINPGAQTAADYRGFYAWRVKHLSSGLTIQDPATKQTYGEGSIIYADQKVQFVTNNAEGNEVDFEALWAQAYFTTNTTAMSNYASNSGNYQNAYERNFHVVSSSLPTHSTYPYTISTINPDGIGTVASVSYSANYACNIDTKLENMTLNMSSYYITANGKNLTIGRGVSNGTSDVASGLFGDRFSSSTSSFAEDSFTFRVESGQYPEFYGLYGTNTSGTSLTGDFTVNFILGSDYDRAKGDDNKTKLTIAGSVEVAYLTAGASANTAINMTVLSGTFGTSSDDTEFYMGWDNRKDDCKAVRTFEVYGGDFLGGVAGGIEKGVAANTEVLKMRIRGGDFHQYFYGAGQYAEATGSRSFIITGGTFDCWVSGACYGTHDSGGDTDGNTTIYFGGKAEQTSTGGIFGAGYGNYATSPNSYTVNKSIVVVADEAQVAGNVYGGGNNGYVCDDATVYLVGDGLRVAGNVYGGANMAASKKKTFVTLESGTVAGSIYGGSNASGKVSDLATVTINGGSVANVYGGGLGENTTMSNGTKVTVSGGTISGNVYGGGQDGILEGDATVEFSGGQVTNIYGAGKGTAQYDSSDNQIAGTGANVAGNTKVTVSGGTVNGAVFGGGENGTVYRATSETINWGFSVGFETTDDMSEFTTTGWSLDNTSGDPHTGSYCAYSSVTSSNSEIFLYSPLVELGGTFSFYYSTRSSSYYGFYQVVVFLENATDYVVLDSGSSHTGSWASTSVSTSTYAGQMGYIGIRHYYNSSYSSSSYPGYLWLDDLSYSHTSTYTYDPISSVVNVKGGEVKGDVFGGGSFGTTAGPTTVNISGSASNPILRQNVFAGAYGSHGAVYVGGLKTVNVSGGRIYGSVYGGSRNANDANALTGYSTTETAATSITNISGGRIDQHVYAAGYYGQSYGSVYAFIGTSAIEGAPNHSSASLSKGSIIIGGSVWAGGDWGVFTGTFGAPTVSGNSNIYINGEGYSTNGNDQSATNYMNIAGAILGSGTSCDAGSGECTLIMSNYGVDVANSGTDSEVNPFAYASRSVNTIQRFHNVIFDNTHIGFNGQGKINSLNTTEQFSLYEIDQNVYLANGSTLVMNNPATQIKSFHNVTCEETYVASPTFTPVAYNGLGTTGGDTDNKIRVNGGSYLEVKYAADPDNIAAGEAIYGELSGFAHMMAGNPDNDATCAYARPKQSQESGNILPSSASDYFNYDNGNWTSTAADGGWLSYRAIDNQYTIDGQYYETGEKDQIRYENHFPGLTRDNSEYYRIWRHGGIHHYVEAVVTAEADGSNTFGAVEVEVQLPSWHANTSYYRFDRTGTSTYNTLIDYGSHVLTYNGANYQDALNESTWMYFDNTSGEQETGVDQNNATVAAALASIAETPNLNYGLVIKPGETMKSTDVNYIITSDADRFLASTEKPFNCNDNTHMPTVTLRLTYSNLMTANTTLDPVLIPLVQCDKDGKILDYVTIALTINTKTQITTGFTTQIYARMDGSLNTRETAVATVVLPSFNVHQSGEESKFYLKKVEFRQGIGASGTDGVALNPTTYQPDNTNYHVVYAEMAESASSSGEQLGINRFAMSIGAQQNPDNSDDWRFPSGQQDGVTPRVYPAAFNSLQWSQDNDRGIFLGQGAGRQPLAFAITLYYNSNVSVNDKTLMGEVIFTIEFDNYADGDEDDDYKSTFTVTAQVYRIGPGDKFYVDGINGVDNTETNRGKFPDMPAKTVNYIFNRLGYMPGDNIFIVNNLPITKETTWNGADYQYDVNLYRYPGGHKLSDGTTENASFANEPYLDELVTVSNTLNMTGINMDGVYAEATKPAGTAHDLIIYPTAESGLGNCTFDGEANAPMIKVGNGGRLNLVTTSLLNNYNGTAFVVNNDSDNGDDMGGAINVAYDGVLAMNSLSTITGNISERGGAVYVDGSMIVSDSVYVFDNHEAPATAKTEAPQNNVYLAKVKEGSFRVVQIGTSANDAYHALAQPEEGETKIGVSKDDWDHAYDGYMPVVFAESGTEEYLEDPYSTPQTLVVHDDNVYKLEKYTSTEYPDSPQYLYWLGTWVTAVTAEPAGFNASQIDTPEELAWAISIVNGENGQTATPGANFIITKDIDMSDNTWVPIGNDMAVYSGNFEGNGHHVTGLKGTLSRTDMGMFGRTSGGTIQNVIVETAFTSTADNLGTVVGTMTNGTVVSNVEAIGKNTNKLSSGNTGGLVAVNDGGTIHSTMSASTISGGNNMGGLVADNRGNLYNSYTVATMSNATNIGGLVAVNNGRVENCYDATSAPYPFAATNNGTIQYCYAAAGNTNYVGDSGEGSDVNLTGHGNYTAPVEPHTYGYMYDDNKVELVSGQNNPYVVDTFVYANNQLALWPGLLSTLNQWVDTTNAAPGNDIVYTHWFRPTTQYLNHDLPVLGFPKDNCMATIGGTALRYGAFDATNNGLDALLERFENETVYIFLYNSANNVTRVPGEKVAVFINEDAVLKQAADAGEFINATVGVTFDNSCGEATDFYNQTLAYDWHMFSTPLADAPLGISYSNDSINPWTMNNMANQVTGVENSYLPDGMGNVGHWDFYSFYEPEYHWVNLKRNSDSHHHYDEPYAHIDYTNEDTLVPGKGYMAAIDKDSYLLNKGTLNGPANDPVSITLTMQSQAPGTDELGYNLLGNPYQAYLNMNAFLTANSMEQYWVYIAESDNYMAGNTRASENPVLPSSTLHPHQGFFVMANRDGQDVKFNYSTMALTTPAANSFFRGDKVNYPLVNLFATSENGKKDLAVIEFNRPEFGGSKKMRAINNANFELASSMNGSRYSILFTEEGTEKVPVHFVTKEEGTFTMTWETYHGTFTSLFLVDNKTGVHTDMLHSDHYTFTSSPDDYASRFYITSKCIGVEEYTQSEGDFAWFDGTDWIVTGKGQLQLFDVLGHVLYSQFATGEQIRLNLDGYAAGVYMLHLTDGSKSKVQKIIIK